VCDSVQNPCIIGIPQAIATKTPPQELKADYSEDHLAKTRAYSLDKKNFALIKGVYDTIESLAFLMYGVLPWMWELSEHLVGSTWPSLQSNEYAVSISFALLTALVKVVEGIPWGLYFTFVIEERHGFNKQTLSLFFIDIFKSVCPPLCSYTTLWCSISICSSVHETYEPTVDI
jgi:STE24 endopeptidase